MVEKGLILFCLLISCQANPVEQSSDDKRPAGSTTYDQRQTGKYNLHVNIKDVQFFSLSDSLASIGDYSDYGDYGDFEGIGDTDTDYDTSHLTVNPVFAFLGSNKPTTSKPTTSPPTEKLPPLASSSVTSESTLSSIKEEATTEKASASTTIKQDSESEIKDSTNHAIMKPAPVEDRKPQQDEAIDYEEIPVEVQYYRAHHQKIPSNSRNVVNRFHKRQPSVQIIDGHGRGNNVKIIENDHPTVKICGRGEFRDNLGRCRVRARRGAGNTPGM